LSLYPDPDGTLWIGTADNGLCRLRDGKFSTISAVQGMPASIISEIAEDDAGNLWMGSHHGILRASKADLNRCADGALKTIRCLSYGRAEGLATLKCSGGFQPNAAKTADGRLWFPTTKGLAIIDPGNFSTNTVPPPVVIEELSVEGAPLALPSVAGTNASPPSAPLEIPPGQPRLEIRFTGLSFVAPEKVRFKYRLEGLEDNWLDGGAKRVIQYSYLRPGNYTFRVTACNNDEVWNDKGAAISFTVLPYFWQTWWFKGFCLLAGAAAVAGIAMGATRQRVRRKLELLERQRALERERARIARDIHDDLGASLTRITLLSQSVRAELEDQQTAAGDVDRIYSTARELTRALDEIVWAVNPRHDTLDSLVAYLGRFAQNFLSSANIRCRLDAPLQLPGRAVTAEIRHNLFLAFKEALNNVVKHAHASEVRVSFEFNDGRCTLVVADNGRGFDPKNPAGLQRSSADGLRSDSGNGLANMRKRLEEIGGECSWETAPGEGTRVRLSLPLKV
jgi:signal transduction histidine kinase